MNFWIPILRGVNSPRELEGQVALVTGGGRGIGRLIALELADAGMRVAVSARSADQVEATAQEIDGLAVTADVSKSEDVEAMVATVERELASESGASCPGRRTRRTGGTCSRSTCWAPIYVLGLFGELLAGEVADRGSRYSSSAQASSARR
jgi:NAD(P)-dependent dehydrogenase (short-subunit alcohol dehydrogenase family)